MELSQKHMSVGRYILYGSLFFTLSVLTLPSLGDSIGEYMQALQIDIRPNTSVEMTYPKRAKPDPAEDILDMSYRLDTLPYAQDKSEAGYVVYPKAGVIIPIVRPNSSDVEKIKAGTAFDHYKYLENGALHYVGTAPDQGVGNMVLAVHSSFEKSKPGRYKTAGQVAPISRAGDKIFVYLATDQGVFDLYIYTIQTSKEIPETEVSILNQDVREKTLTTFTCYPIGTSDARRVNVATLEKVLPANEIPTYVKATTPQEHTSAPVADIQPVASAPLFTTQSAAPVVEPTNDTGALEESGIVREVKNPYAPSFMQRVKYRPIVYRSAITLITKVGFKRSNLKKLHEVLGGRITAITNSTNEAKKKKIIPMYLMIQEIIEGFMK